MIRNALLMILMWFAVGNVNATNRPLQTWYQDLDNDGYGNTAVTLEADEQPVGYVAVGGDCNDTNNAVNPGVPEICGNGIDDDCDGSIDVDNVPPTAICIGAAIMNLNENGTTFLYTETLDDGSFDNCSPAIIQHDSIVFTCANQGSNTVTMTVTDSAGNSSQCSTLIFIKDKMIPIAVCAENVGIKLDALGHVTLAPEDVDNGSYDNCSIDFMWLDITEFDCDDLGEHQVTLSVMDVIGNINQCITTVIVTEKTKPFAICEETLVAGLDENGIIELLPENVDNGSFDNCTPVTMSLDTSTFDCSDLGLHILTLTVEDSVGNQSQCTTPVTVFDKWKPIAICTESITLEINTSGNATLAVADVNNGSSDNCAIATMSLDTTTFDCDDLGLHIVTLTITDPSENVNTCTAEVIVVDNLPPTALCVADMTFDLGNQEQVTLTAQMVDAGSTDNCSMNSMSISQTVFTAANMGPNTVALTVVDQANNVNTCQTTVFIKQSTATTDLSAQNPVVVVAPNPSSGQYQLIFAAGKTPEWMRVYNQAGALVLHHADSSIDLSQQPDGVYVLWVKMAGQPQPEQITLVKAR